jgi:hypothetical protein
LLRFDNRRRQEEVAEKALEFVKRFTTITARTARRKEDSDE